MTAIEQEPASDPLPDERPAAVRLRGVRRTFAASGGGPRLVALDGLDLTVGAGEIVAIIGPNGCGKSTLLRVAGGLLAPDSGSVEIEGRPVVGPDPAVGFVFQEPRLLPWRDARANVDYPLELAGWPAAERAERVTSLLGLVGLGAFVSARPHQLSGGMRQRVAIARALALRPTVLLLDEPFSALDALTRERFQLELLRLWERTGTAMAIVTHSIPEAIFVADRVLVLSPRPGRVVAEVPSPLGWPRALADLADPSVAATSTRIRTLLGPTPGENDAAFSLAEPARVPTPLEPPPPGVAS
jgi:NitT/TauT family transport system ATP-binding protein